MSHVSVTKSDGLEHAPGARTDYAACGRRTDGAVSALTASESYSPCPDCAHALAAARVFGPRVPSAHANCECSDECLMVNGSAERDVILAREATTDADLCQMWTDWMRSAWREIDLAFDLGAIERHEPPFWAAEDGQREAECPFCGYVLVR